MPRLNGGFSVLKHDFNKIVQNSAYNTCAKNCRARGWGTLDRVKAKNTGNVEIIGKLQRSVGVGKHKYSIIFYHSRQENP
ncbi:hypothetical protein ACJIZ3_014855 [Penstemon smallii]|uniref:Uncharacterized protein n=1 Tax=Penstemon smallii TaxID=265156 RepID=A0ABD3RKT9_9LAMI